MVNAEPAMSNRQLAENLAASFFGGMRLTRETWGSDFMKEEWDEMVSAILEGIEQDGIAEVFRYLGDLLDQYGEPE